MAVTPPSTDKGIQKMSNTQITPNSSPPELLNYVLLHGRYPVLDELVQFVRHQLEDLACWIRLGKRYTAAQLMGSPCWNLLTPDEKRLCGSVIAHRAKEGQLPIAKCEKRCSGEANSYMASPGAEAWLLSQLGIHTSVAPSVMLAAEGSAITSSKE
jgi:hypothetical protein